MQFRLATLVLAAGASERYGDNKLLSRHPSGVTLIEHVINACTALSSSPLIVTGRWHNELSAALASSACMIKYHAKWSRGMGSSIACGVNELVATEDGTHQTGDLPPTHILIVLGDLPLITTSSLRMLVDASQKETENVIASKWMQKLTAPAIFPAKYFTALQSLDGDEGARGVIKRARDTFPDELTEIEHPQAGTDIDTRSDWAHLAK